MGIKFDTGTPILESISDNIKNTIENSGFKIKPTSVWVDFGKTFYDFHIEFIYEDGNCEDFYMDLKEDRLYFLNEFKNFTFGDMFHREIELKVISLWREWKAKD